MVESLDTREVRRTLEEDVYLLDFEYLVVYDRFRQIRYLDIALTHFYLLFPKCRSFL